MTIQILGTNVINDSRQLENITNLKTINSQSILGTGNIDSVFIANLGVLLTTSGTNPVLSGLDLTSYDRLIICIDSISHTSLLTRSYLIGTSTSDDQAITATQSSVSNLSGLYLVDLNTGIYTVTLGGTTGTIWSGYGPLVNTSTSISIALNSTGNFDSGKLIIYGIKRV